MLDPDKAPNKQSNLASNPSESKAYQLTEEDKRLLKVVEEARPIGDFLLSRGVRDLSVGGLVDVKLDSIKQPTVDEMMKDARKSGNYSPNQLMQLEQHMRKAQEDSAKAQSKEK